MGDSYHSIKLPEYQTFYKLLTEITSDPEWDIGVDLTKLCQPDCSGTTAHNQWAVRLEIPFRFPRWESAESTVLFLVFIEVFNELNLGHRPAEIIALPDMTT